jgi:DNA recombination protein RmuC
MWIPILFLIIGISISACVFLWRMQEGKKISERKILELEFLTQAAHLKSTEQQERLQHLQAENQNFSQNNAAYQTKIALLEQDLEVRKKEMVELQKQFTEQFQNIANQVMIRHSSNIQREHKEKLEDILLPFKDKIEKFESRVQITHEQNIRDNQSLKEQLIRLQELNQNIGQEAKNLTSALKGQNKTQGNWGEMILESILERSGLVKGREYEVQVSLKNEEDKRYQPDVLIRLPEQKTIIIDSKVSLNAYERYCNAETPDLQQKYLKEHLASLKKHIKDLSEKNYQNLYGVQSLDFVLIFIPIEPAFNLAIQEDQNLYTEAFEKNIILISTSTLLATLRTIASIWKQENQNKNAIEIAKQGGDLYDKFVALVEDLVDLGKKMKGTQQSYEDAMNKLSTGKGNLLRRVEKMKELGLSASKVMNAKLLERAQVEEI